MEIRLLFLLVFRGISRRKNIFCGSFSLFSPTIPDKLTAENRVFAYKTITALQCSVKFALIKCKVFFWSIEIRLFHHLLSAILPPRSNHAVNLRA